MKLITIITLLLGSLLSTQAFAQLTVNRSVIEFSNAEKVQDIEVMNTGDFKLYVDMRVAEIINPGSDNPTRQELTDPRTAAVLVSPKQLLLGPGQRKRVRVILRQPADTSDRVFRLSVKPYTGKLQLAEQAPGTKSSAIKVLIGYDLLLLSRPEAADPRLQVNRTNSTIHFKNNGNTNVLLRKIIQCDSTGADCEELQASRLYAGDSYVLDLPRKGSASEYPVEVWQAVGLQNEREMY